MKCPFCTSIISGSTHPQIASALRSGLDKAVNECIASILACDDNTAPVVAISLPTSFVEHRSVTACVGASVSSLPMDLQELVKDIQRRQSDLKASLHYCPAAVK